MGNTLEAHMFSPHGDLVEVRMRHHKCKHLLVCIREQGINRELFCAEDA
jgi:hypothetical protein